MTAKFETITAAELREVHGRHGSLGLAAQVSLLPAARTIEALEAKLTEARAELKTAKGRIAELKAHFEDIIVECDQMLRAPIASERLMAEVIVKRCNRALSDPTDQKEGPT